MLMEREAVLNILVCPKTGGTLAVNGNSLVSASSGTTYEMIDGLPVLIDFDSSILSPVDVRAPVVRRSSGSAWLKRIVSPDKPATAANVAWIRHGLWAPDEQRRVLVIGGGTIGQGMKALYEDPRAEIVAFDIYASPHVHFLADAHRLPLPDASFDLVVVQAVLEHVLDPGRVVGEIHRVLAAGGIVYAETPFLQHVHEGAYDFTRFTESGHRYLFRHFEALRSGVVGGAGTQLVWANEHFVRGLFRSRTAGKIVKLFCFWLQYLDRWIPEAYNVDAASGVYFVGRKQNAPVRESDMVAHYKGAQQH